MKLITVPQLRLGQLQTLTEQTIKLTEPIGQLSPWLADVQAAFKPFLTGMLKDPAGSDKKTLDKTRDQYLSGFFLNVKSESYYPHEDATMQEVVQKLLRVTEKYGFKINKLPYDEETAAIDNLLAELGSMELSGIPHLARWIGKIKAANESFKAASKDYLETYVKNSTTESASVAAPALTVALEDLYTMLFAHAKVAADQELVNVYQKLSELVDTYR